MQSNGRSHPLKRSAENARYVAPGAKKARATSHASNRSLCSNSQSSSVYKSQAQPPYPPSDSPRPSVWSAYERLRYAARAEGQDPARVPYPVDAYEGYVLPSHGFLNTSVPKDIKMPFMTADYRAEKQPRLEATRKADGEPVSPKTVPKGAQMDAREKSL